MIKSINKLINNLIIISIIFTILFVFIISQDTYHIDTCHDDDCFKCSIIQMAQIIMNIIELFILLSIVGFIIFYFLSKIKKSSINIKKESLVYKKVQLNE